MRRMYLHCVDCNQVVRISPDPECVHYGKLPRRRNSESVTVVFRGPNGRVSIPWSPDAKIPKGFVREEVRGARAVRRLEKELDAQDLIRHRRNQESEHRVFGPSRQRIREDLHQMIREGVAKVGDRTVQLTDTGKEYARAALKKLDGGYSKNFDPDNHLES